MTSDSVQPAPRRRRVRGGLVAAGGILTTLGAALTIVVTVLVALAAGSVLRAPQPSPVDDTLRLDSGSYTVLLEDPDEGAAQLEAVEVTGPDGERVRVGPMGSVSESITIRSTTYEGVARFDIPADGDYEVRIETTAPADVAVVRSVRGALLPVVGAAAGGVVGVVLLVVGVVLLAVGLVGRATASPGSRRTAAGGGAS